MCVPSKVRATWPELTQFLVVTVAVRFSSVWLDGGSVAETDATPSMTARNARACMVEFGDVDDGSKGGDTTRAARRLCSVAGEGGMSYKYRRRMCKG